MQLKPFDTTYILRLFQQRRLDMRWSYSQLDTQRRTGYNHLISNKRGWNKCFIKNTPKIQKTEIKYIKTKSLPQNHRYPCYIFRACYNSSNGMMVKPMKTLDLHYPMIQFLRIANILSDTLISTTTTTTTTTTTRNSNSNKLYLHNHRLIQCCKSFCKLKQKEP